MKLKLIVQYLQRAGLLLGLSPAQGLYKQTVFKKQAGGLGVPESGAGGQIVRRRTSVATATRQSTTLDEIVSHRQDTGVVFGQKDTGLKLDCLLSAGTYSPIIASVLMADFAAVTPLVAGTDITSQAAGPQFVDGSAGFLAAGLKVGMVGRWTGFTTTATANNDRNFWITALTAGDMTGKFLDGTAVAPKAPETGSVTFTVVGKISLAPLTAHTNDFFTWEEWYSDKARSELFPDIKSNKIDFSIPAAGASGVAFDLVGLGVRTLGSSQVLTTPAAETTTGVSQAVNGAIYINGVLVEHVTGLSLSVDRSLTPVGASIGNPASPDFNHGNVKVNGSFTAMFDDTVLQAIFDAGTKVSLAVVAAVDTSATADFMAFTLGKIALMGDTPDDGLKAIMRTYPFTAEINGDGDAALAWDKTILTVQDSAAA
jgi:hypothetical protein